MYRIIPVIKTTSPDPTRVSLNRRHSVRESGRCSEAESWLMLLQHGFFQAQHIPKSGLCKSLRRRRPYGWMTIARQGDCVTSPTKVRVPVSDATNNKIEARPPARKHDLSLLHHTDPPFLDSLLLHAILLHTHTYVAFTVKNLLLLCSRHQQVISQFPSHPRKHVNDVSILQAVFSHITDWSSTMRTFPGSFVNDQKFLTTISVSDQRPNTVFSVDLSREHPLICEQAKTGAKYVGPYP
jgi:hypothetical protein